MKNVTYKRKENVPQRREIVFLIILKGSSFLSVAAPGHKVKLWWEQPLSLATNNNLDFPERNDLGFNNPAIWLDLFQLEQSSEAEQP